MSKKRRPMGVGWQLAELSGCCCKVEQRLLAFPNLGALAIVRAC